MYKLDKDLKVGSLNCVFLSPQHEPGFILGRSVKRTTAFSDLGGNPKSDISVVYFEFKSTTATESLSQASKCRAFGIAQYTWSGVAQTKLYADMVHIGEAFFLVPVNVVFV